MAAGRQSKVPIFAGRRHQGLFARDHAADVWNMNHMVSLKVYIAAADETRRSLTLCIWPNLEAGYGNHDAAIIQ